MTVSSSTNRVSYNGNSSTTVFAYTFKIFDEDDLTVIIRAANGVETVKTITTHYTVSGVGNAGGGNVTMLTAPATGETLVILREQDLVQELDIVPNDPFPAESVESALDKLTFMVQQHEETLGRTIRASRTNTITGAEFTISPANRANKVFSFDSSGNLSIAQELGTYRGNWAASTAYNQRDLVKDTSNDNIYIANTAHTSSGTQPISTNADVAKWDLIVDAAAAATSASAAAASASAASSSASAASSSASAASSSASAAASSASAASTSASNAAASYDSFDDRYLGAKSSDPSVDNDGAALIDGALYFDTVNNVMKVYDLGTTAWLRTTPTSSDQTNINAVSANSSNINTVAGISADITSVAGIGSDVTTVSGISGNVTTVAGISADVTSVAGVAANVTTVAGISANVTTVAGISANVTTVAGISADVTTVAANVAGVTSFAEKYRVGANDPTTSLDTGDLFYNTSSNLLKIYNGSAWETGVTPGSGFMSGTNNLSDVADAAASLINLGLTATAAELNVLDGITSSTAELNLLDGVTSSTAELNLVDGSVANTVVNSKAVIYGASGEITANQIDILAQGDLRLQDTTGGQYIALQAPGTVSSSFTLTLPAADGTSGQFLKTDGAGALSFETVSSSVQYPQESKSADYTLVLADAGKQIFHPASDTAIRYFTIPANSSVAFPIGTVVLFTVENGAKPVFVKVTSDTIVSNGTTTGDVFVPEGNTLYCIKTTSTKWQAYHMYQADVIANEVVAVASSSSPYVLAYPISASGFGVKFANPASLPAGSSNGVRFSPDADVIAVAHGTSPYISVYAWSATGFGSKFSNPASLPAGEGFKPKFSNDGTALVVPHTGSPFISAYPWSGSGFGSKFSNPATLPPGGTFFGSNVAFAPDDSAVALTFDASPYIHVYAWSGSGFGTKFANPATLPAGTCRAVEWNPAGDVIVVGSDSSPYVLAYPWSGSGFGTKYSDPSSAVGGGVRGISWHPAGDVIATSSDNNKLYAYAWSGSGWGTRYSEPGTQITGTGADCEFSVTGNIIGAAHSTSPYISVYPWSASGFGTKFANPATLPSGNGIGIAFALL